MQPVSLKVKIVLGTVALLTCFAAGRWSAPVHVKTVEVDKKTTQTDTDRDKHKETTVTEVTDPSGTKTTVTKTVEDTKTDRKTNTVETDTKSHEVSSNVAKVTVAALVGLRIDDLTKPPVYGLLVQRPILGPITVGLWGLSNTTAGVSLGLTF